MELSRKTRLKQIIHDIRNMNTLHPDEIDYICRNASPEDKMQIIVIYNDVLESLKFLTEMDK